MDKSNPAVYECPKGAHSLHLWVRLPDGSAACKYCKAALTKVQTDDCFYDTGQKEILMHDREAVEMMQRCKSEITDLRQQVDRLQPQAQAYELIAQVLSYLPKRTGVGMSEDIVWVLDKRIREIEQILAPVVNNSTEV